MKRRAFVVFTLAVGLSWALFGADLVRADEITVKGRQTSGWSANHYVWSGLTNLYSWGTFTGSITLAPNAVVYARWECQSTTFAWDKLTNPDRPGVPATDYSFTAPPQLSHATAIFNISQSGDTYCAYHVWSTAGLFKITSPVMKFTPSNTGEGPPPSQPAPGGSFGTEQSAPPAPSPTPTPTPTPTGCVGVCITPGTYTITGNAAEVVIGPTVVMPGPEAATTYKVIITSRTSTSNSGDFRLGLACTGGSNGDVQLANWFAGTFNGTFTGWPGGVDAGLSCWWKLRNLNGGTWFHTITISYGEIWLTSAGPAPTPTPTPSPTPTPTPSPTSGTLDSDGDGYSDQVEAGAGTNPNDASSYPGGPGSGGYNPPPQYPTFAPATPGPNQGGTGGLDPNAPGGGPPNPSGIAACDADDGTFTKVGQAPLRPLHDTSFPGSWNPLDYIPPIMNMIANIPLVVGNAGQWMVNTGVDLVVPGSCLGSITDRQTDRMMTAGPLALMTSVQVQIEASIGASGGALPTICVPLPGGGQACLPLADWAAAMQGPRGVIATAVWLFVAIGVYRVVAGSFGFARAAAPIGTDR